MAYRTVYLQGSVGTDRLLYETGATDPAPVADYCAIADGYFSCRIDEANLPTTHPLTPPDDLLAVTAKRSRTDDEGDTIEAILFLLKRDLLPGDLPIEEGLPPVRWDADDP